MVVILQAATMSSRRGGGGGGGRITDEEINELISKLQALLPESSRSRGASRVRTFFF